MVLSFTIVDNNQKMYIHVYLYILYNLFVSDNIDAWESQCIQPPQTGTSCPSTSLRGEVERQSMMFSQSGFVVKSVSCSQLNSQTHSLLNICKKPNPSLCDDAHLPSSSIMETASDHGNKQETVLLNATMEMTLSNATEIVTVESKAKKTGCSHRPKCKKKTDQAFGSNETENMQVKNSAYSRLSYVENAPTCTLLQTDDQAVEDIGQCMSVITCGITKLSESKFGSHQKRTKDKLKSHNQAKSKQESSDIVSPDLEDYFKDPDIIFSKASVTLLPEKECAEEARSKIACRKSRTKQRNVLSVTRKDFITMPLHSYESQNRLEQTCNKVEEDHVSIKPKTMMSNAGGCHKSRCRRMFVISKTNADPSTNTASPEIEQDMIPSTGPTHCKAEELSTVTHANIDLDYLESDPYGYNDGCPIKEAKSSCKCSWLATQDSGSPEDDLSSNDYYGFLPAQTLFLKCSCALQKQSFRNLRKPGQKKRVSSITKRSCRRWTHLII